MNVQNAAPVKLHEATISAALARMTVRLAQCCGRILRLISDATGLTDLHCRVKHKPFHHLHQIEYGGGYVCVCDRCRHVCYSHR